jgi:NAD(P)-dependent dehydrogenase (short-subunit alcohol dehydrogenase family)
MAWSSPALACPNRCPTAPTQLDGAARTHDSRLRPFELDFADQRSVSAAIGDVTAEAGHIDVVIHIMESAPRGPVESFTPYQLAQIYVGQAPSACMPAPANRWPTPTTG